jgi:hypothetical protein
MNTTNPPAGYPLRTRVRSVQHWLARLTEDTERLSDPEESARGRILSAALSGTWVIRVPAELPVRNKVGLRRLARRGAVPRW